MTTKKLVPRASGEGAMGVTDNAWGEAYYDTGNFNKGLFVSGHNITQVIAETVTQGGLGGEWERNVLDIYYNGGNVGIGTADPTQKLDINGVTTFGGGNGFIRHDSPGWLALQAGTSGVTISNNVNSEELVTVLDNGNVGIGTTNPGVKLDVVNSSSTEVTSTFNNTAGGAPATIHIIEDEMSLNHVGLFVGAADLSSAVLTTKHTSVGIGTPDPTGKLHIFDSSISNNDFLGLVLSNYNYAIGQTGQSVSIEGRVRNDTGGDNGVAKITFGKDSDFSTVDNRDGNIQFHIMRGDNGTATFEEKMRINSNGNVGIGTTDPGAALHVHAKDDSANALALWVVDKPHQNSIISAYENGNVSIGDFNYKDNTGRVGIGTTDPDGKLEVKGGFSYLEGLSLKPGSGTVSEINSGSNSYDLSIKNGAGESLRIKANGNVGIGTTDPAVKLHVQKLGTPSVINTEGINMTGNGWAAYTTCSSDQNGILRGSTIGVYRPSTGDTFSGVVGLSSRNGDGHYTWSDNSGNLRTSTSSAEIGGTGGTVVGTQTSDERLKNIESDFEYGLEQVMQLQPIAYILKDDQDEIRRLGFGAQTTQGIIPEVVYDTRECVDGYDTDPEDEHKTIARSEQNKLAMKYVELVPVLTKAIQEQQQLIEDLKSRIETLENK